MSLNQFNVPFLNKSITGNILVYRAILTIN